MKIHAQFGRKQKREERSKETQAHIHRLIIANKYNFPHLPPYDNVRFSVSTKFIPHISIFKT